MYTVIAPFVLLLRDTEQEMGRQSRIMAENLGLQKGDLVEITRRNLPVVRFSHWAVYIGDGYVVHNTPRGKSKICDTTSSTFNSGNNPAASVHVKSLSKVANNDTPQKNNLLDPIIIPFPAPKIVMKAMSRLGEKKYNVVFNNCEHFATSCRYGLPHSRQIFRIFKYIFVWNFYFFLREYHTPGQFLTWSNCVNMLLCILVSFSEGACE